jgi:defect in organelle trafficking protein DotC
MLKRSYKLIPLIFFVFIIVGCSSTKDTPDDFSRVASLRPSSASGINNVRATALKQTARSVGAQAGLAWRARQINRILVAQKYKLTQVFNFNYLLLDHNVLPPVLTEANNILNLADDQTIRLADKEYQIVYPPRFVTAPPTWRDYIWMNYKKPEAPNATLLPKNSRESVVWNEFIKVGWNDGVIQANEIFLANLSRLTRDFNGMVLYRKLYAQNMVTSPFVSEADLGITGDSNDLKINDKVLRITSTSELKGDSKKWNPVITEKQEDDYGEGNENSESILSQSIPPKGGRG